VRVGPCATPALFAALSLSELAGATLQVAFIGGVADSSGYGWAIAKQLANAGATIIVGTWPPVLTLFERGLKKGFGEDSKLNDGSDMKIAKVPACMRQRLSGMRDLPACGSIALAGTLAGNPV
jgi:enoyl-[acyl-carrier-protein] reductase (NADH)